MLYQRFFRFLGLSVKLSPNEIFQKSFLIKNLFPISFSVKLRLYQLFFPILKLISENITHRDVSKIMFSIKNYISIILSVNFRLYQQFFPIVRNLSHKIDFKAVEPHNGHAESVRVKISFFLYPFTKWSEQMQNLFFSILRQY